MSLTLLINSYFSEVFNFCTRQTQDEVNRDSHLRGSISQQPNNHVPGADFIGAELYEKLQDFITKHVQERAKVLELIYPGFTFHI